MSRLALSLALVLGLAACDRAAEAPKPAASPVRPSTEWAFGMGKNSVEMAHFTDGQMKDADLRLVCAVGQGFLVLLPKLTPVGSEERLTLGAGDIAHGLVAKAADPGVQATGPIDDELLSVFESGAPIAVNHGAQNAGPYEPPAALRRAFADSCRKLRARGEV